MSGGLLKCKSSLKHLVIDVVNCLMINTETLEHVLLKLNRSSNEVIKVLVHFRCMLTGETQLSVSIASVTYLRAISRHHVLQCTIRPFLNQHSTVIIFRAHFRVEKLVNGQWLLNNPVSSRLRGGNTDSPLYSFSSLVPVSLEKLQSEVELIKVIASDKIGCKKHCLSV